VVVVTRPPMRVVEVVVTKPPMRVVEVVVVVAMLVDVVDVLVVVATQFAQSGPQVSSSRSHCASRQPV
jgi:hypothetical protein